MPQSQVDQLISDLMDIIVRAATGSSSDAANANSADAVAEVVALSMMQAPPAPGRLFEFLGPPRHPTKSLCRRRYRVRRPTAPKRLDTDAQSLQNGTVGQRSVA